MEGDKGWREREPRWPERKELRALGGMREHLEGRGPGETVSSPLGQRVCRPWHIRAHCQRPTQGAPHAGWAPRQFHVMGRVWGGSLYQAGPAGLPAAGRFLAVRVVTANLTLDEVQTVLHP